MSAAATDKERRLAELAVRKNDLNAELAQVREELKVLARDRDIKLPVVTVANGCAVMISKPQFAGSVPVTKVARFAPPPEEEDTSA